MSLVEVGAIATTVGTGAAVGKLIWDIVRRGKRPRWLSPPVILSVFFGVASIGLWLYDRASEGQPPSPSQEIHIVSPATGNAVPQETMVEGYALRELTRDQYLYVVVEWAGRWWPQYSDVRPVYSARTKRWEWNAPVTIGLKEDISKSFNIVAVVTDEVVRQRFQGWLRGGEEVRWKDWPGLLSHEVEQWGEVRIHDRVNVTRR